MGFMQTWKEWCQRQWELWGNKLNPAYKNIETWKAPDWAKNMGDKIWDKLDDITKKYVYDFIIITLKKFDEDFAKVLIKNLIDTLSKWFKTTKRAK